MSKKDHLAIVRPANELLRELERLRLELEKTERNR